MKAYCLASSSSGNCFVLEFDINGRPTRIMVECGLPMSEIYSKLNEIGIQLSSIDACLITHAHGDHSKSAQRLNKLGVHLFAHKKTFEALGIIGHNLIVGEANKIARGIAVMPFEVEHDIEGALGYVIKSPSECVIFIIDHKRFSQNLKNFKPDYVFIECNFDDKMVYAQLSEATKILNDENVTGSDRVQMQAKKKQLDRNINSHCSLRGTIKGLRKMNLSRCRTIFLTHLSDRYANEYKMKSTIEGIFHIRTYVCKKGGGIK